MNFALPDQFPSQLQINEHSAGIDIQVVASPWHVCSRDIPTDPPEIFIKLYDTSTADRIEYVEDVLDSVDGMEAKFDAGITELNTEKLVCNTAPDHDGSGTWTFQMSFCVADD